MGVGKESAGHKRGRGAYRLPVAREVQPQPQVQAQAWDQEQAHSMKSEGHGWSTSLGRGSCYGAEWLSTTESLVEAGRPARLLNQRSQARKGPWVAGPRGHGL